MPPLLQQAQPKLLITGATGCIGGAWLERLLHRLPPDQILVLVRRPEDARLLPDGVSICVGDVKLPLLGFGDDLVRSVSESIEEIIHCAADVRFSISLEESRATNVIGTCNVLDLARRSGRLTKFAHVSTVYVVGDRSGDCFEEPIEAAKFLNSYEQSKCEAEWQVLEAMSAVPTAIYRLSTVIGESSSGYVRNMNYFHQTLRLALRSPLPAVPGLPQAPIDLIATDWAAAALDYLFDQRFAAGSIFHVCSGPLYRVGHLRAKRQSNLGYGVSSAAVAQNAIQE